MWVQSTVVCPKWGGMFLIDVCICWCHNVISCSRGTLFELWAQRWLCKIIVEFRVHTIVRLLVINSSYYYYILRFLPRNRRSTYICNIYIDIPVYTISYDYIVCLCHNGMKAVVGYRKEKKWIKISCFSEL